MIREMAWYDAYLQRGQVDRSANTTPGNKAGGLSNIVEKAMGSVIKSGSMPISAVLSPGEIAASYFSEAASFGIATPPQIASFSAAPPSFLPAQPVALTWNVVTPPGKPLTSLTISNGIGTVTGNTGSVTLQPETATTYTITAVNADGTATAQTTVAPRSQPLVLRHRWSFNESAGPAAANAPIPDRIGDAGAEQVGVDGLALGGKLSFAGGVGDRPPWKVLMIAITQNAQTTQRGHVCEKPCRLLAQTTMHTRMEINNVHVMHVHEIHKEGQAPHPAARRVLDCPPAAIGCGQSAEGCHQLVDGVCCMNAHLVIS
jgi:hypothetical protein